MSYNFYIGDNPLSLSESSDFGLEGNGLCRLEGPSQAERRRISSEQEQNDNYDMTFLGDGPPKFTDFYVSPTLPSELFCPWPMNYQGLVDTGDDCISGAVTNAQTRTYSSVQQHNANALVGNCFSVKSDRDRQLFAERVRNSIENLQILHNKISNMVALDSDGCSESEGLAQGEKRNTLSQRQPNDQSTKFEEAVSNFQVSNRHHQFSVAQLNVESSENHIAARVAHVPNRDEGSGYCSQTTQEYLTETFSGESPASRVEEGGESEYNGGKRSASTAELEDLLSSLQMLLSVLKNHDENEQMLRAKMQVLREKKQALHDEKQQYKRQRNSQYRPPLSQESVQVWS